MYVKGVYKVGLPKWCTPEMGGVGWREQNVSNRCWQKPNRETDVVTGAETFISFYSAVKTENKITVWINKAGDGQVFHLKKNPAIL